MQRVLVTGGGRGIGKAVALAFAATGAQVAIAGRDPASLAAACREADGFPGAVWSVPGDVADAGSAVALVAQAYRQLGGLDVLVNNAGISEPTPLHGPEAADQVWHRVLATNLHGPWWVSRAAVPVMPVGGRIIMIGAQIGQVGRAGYAAYCASKQALVGLVRCLALELAPQGVTVNAVAPGGVATDLLEAELDYQAHVGGLSSGMVRERALQRAPFGRFVAPADVAALVTYLAGPAASGITAQVLGLDGLSL